MPTDAIKYTVSTDSVKELTTKLPNVELAEADLSYASTDIIVRAEYVEVYLLNKMVNVEQITLCKSQFGRIAIGNTCGVDISSLHKLRICNSSTIASVEKQLKNLYESETFDIELSLSEEKLKCVEHFESTYPKPRRSVCH